MAFMKKEKDTKDITEADVQYAIAVQSVWIHKRYTAVIPNCYTKFDNEADLFGIRPSGLCDEIEIKVSKADYRVDEQKTVLIENESYDHWRDKYTKTPKRDALQDGKMSNYFWYAFPKGLVDHADVPEWAGIIEVDGFLNAREVRMPKRLHGGKMTIEEQLKQIKKLGFRFWNLVKKNKKSEAK
ncbi:hypothetical protein [Vibrio phage XZ1]|uniref:Uncharacterized protein n=2 Tax=Schizotequatrovirus TaxID=1198137 RepID=V9LYZ7_9CAUD|nr:hypothetical protein CF80_gp023 [Vibrio phage VH7D]YP_009201229.1 hypothetical protein AVU32_gp126 [Vibrio phage ValKK3]ALP47466.1 hypothetical protein phiST2_0001 [Vibrio phage phi-ST2]QBX05955.1 hypothetical protein Va3_001 [Vibrio phage Va3]QNJ54965.1 hypothetical protein vBValMR11Z_39 [Vibrio phage vB_ValM_R11Z]UOL51394.1 hypothetical protein [Vibrio phage XZ1]URQ03719.1 hypothetical protein PVA23_342 [Vibrio phage PVA23]